MALSLARLRAAWTVNRFDRLEWAGAFGDLGTLVPFIVAYVGVVGVEAGGVLLAFGVAMIAAGVYYRTPFPVQPMKAAGAVAATQAAQTAIITPGAIYAASLVTGLLWLLLGMTGLARKVTALVPRPVVTGIILGLGFAFMLEGVKMMAGAWLVAGIALLATFVLLTNRAVPAMFLLLVGGAGYALVADPALGGRLLEVEWRFEWPAWPFASVSLNEVLIGAVFLALPQVPLTLGNAVLAITEENNRLFPGRPVSERGVAVSTGLMNVLGAQLGGVPMCHGAGGMAGHVRFGARTGGAPIILGAILVFVGLFLSGSVTTLLALFPRPFLGVILFLTGAQLALGSCDLGKDKNSRFVSVVTAASAVWNVGLAFVLGIVVHQLLKKGLARL